MQRGQKIQRMQRMQRVQREKDITEKGHRKLLVWQRAHVFVLDVYRVTSGFPKEESFGLVSQLRRAAVSIPANIAEGQGRNTKSQYLQFLNVSNASLAETEYYLELSKDLGYLPSDSYKELENQRKEIGFLLHQLISALRKV
jgi:four helix bundle protein